jgi:hypothetical protein
MAAPSAALDHRGKLEYVAATAPGKVWIAAFSCIALLPAVGYLAIPFALAIGLASFRPGWRRSIFSTAALTLFALNFISAGPAPERLRATLLLVATVWITGLLAWTRRPGGQHVLWALHAMAIVAMAGICAARGRLWSGTAAAALCTLVPELLWRSSYWIKWRRREQGCVPIWRHLFAALPFLGAGGVPFGKGPSYLAKHEALNGKALAASQVEGVRLLSIGLAWRAVDSLLQLTLWGIRVPWLGDWHPFAKALLPSMETLMRIPASYALWQRWGGLYGELFHNIIALAFYGHTIVGFFCLMGFRIPRNTSAPLATTTIVDFWGRYYFYFKELLMDFFFFPAFLKTSSMPVIWRTVLATWAAAFFGNFYYHVILYAPVLASGDTRGYRSLVMARMMYCALLATGLSISFARVLRQTAAPKGSRIRKACQVIVVASFFAFLHVWNYGGAPISMERRWHLWKTLAGMETKVGVAYSNTGETRGVHVSRVPAANRF